MSPTPVDILVHLFKNNHETLHSLVEGINQEESMLQPPFEGNCMNWVVGHVLNTYHICQNWLGAPAPDSDFFSRMYGYGSEPMTDPGKASSLLDMLKRLDAGLMLITSQLECVPPVELDSPVDLWFGTVTKTEALYFMLWHASYHTGQLEPLRQLGKKKN